MTQDAVLAIDQGTTGSAAPLQGVQGVALSLLVVICLSLPMVPEAEATTGSSDGNETNRAVLQLLKQNRRDAAFAKLIRRQAPLGTRLPRAGSRIEDVVVYPQSDGDPLYAVFSRSGNENHITLFDPAGTLVPFYGWRDLVTEDRFADLDGDGRSEIVGNLPIRIPVVDSMIYMEAFFVLPVNRKNRPTLVVLYNARIEDLPSGGPPWDWDLFPGADGASSIVLGPRKSTTKSKLADPANPIFVWSEPTRSFEGPAGGYIQPFLRVADLEGREFIGYARTALSKKRPFHVGGRVLKPKKISDPPPEYTPEARRAETEGVVILQTTIDEHGDVDFSTVLKGLPNGLSIQATKAVRQWKFEPATYEGAPVAVMYNLTVKFSLD